MGATGSRRLEVHPDADAELSAAAHYYEQRRIGLGDEYLREMEALVDFALGSPEAGAPVAEGVRWLLSRRFPYAVVYRWRDERMQVLSFAHHRRRPGYWRLRAGD